MFGTDDDIDIQKEIDSLLTMVKTPVDRSVLEADLDRYLNKYLMDIERSKRAIIKDHGGTDSDYKAPDAETCQIKDAVCNKNCTLIAKVNGINNTITPNGKRLQVIGISDDTGVIPVEIWEREADVKIGKTYRFRNCRIKYNSYNDVNVVSCEPDDISESDETIKNTAYEMLRPLAVGPESLVTGKKDLVILGKILESNKVVTSNGKNKTEGNILVDGVIYGFDAWYDVSLNEGEEVLIDRVMMTYNKYRRELLLNMTDKSFVYRRV